MDDNRWTGAKIDNLVVLKMKRCGQEQDFPLSSASITSPTKDRIASFSSENMKWVTLCSHWCSQDLREEIPPAVLHPCKANSKCQKRDRAFSLLHFKLVSFWPKKMHFGSKTALLSQKRCCWPKRRR